MSEVNEKERVENTDNNESVEVMSGIVESTETGDAVLEEKTDNKLELKSSISLGTISTNLDEIKADVEKKIAEYTGMVITDETYMDAKKYVTMMSSIETQVSQFKTSLRKKVLSFIEPQEKKCIEINDIIEKGKSKIKAVTDTYDEKVREANKEKAQAYIDEAVIRFSLKPEYAERMQLKEEYYKTLHVVIKQIKGDVEKQAMNLRDEQTKRENLELVLKTTVDAANTNISQKMKVEMFAADMEKAMSDKNLDGEWLSGRITAKATEIKRAEDEIAKKAVAEAIAKKMLEDEERARLQKEKEEKEAKERADELERQAAETILANSANVFDVPEPVSDIKTVEEFVVPEITGGNLFPVLDVDDVSNTESEKVETETIDPDDFRKSIMSSRHIKPVVPERDDRKYIMTIEISGSRADLKLIGETIKDSCNKNNCTYKVREDLFHQI